MKTLVTRLKNKGKDAEEVGEIADEMAQKLIVLLQSDKTTGESKGVVRYAFDGTPDQIAEWEKPITLQDVETLKRMNISFNI